MTQHTAQAPARASRERRPWNSGGDPPVNALLSRGVIRGTPLACMAAHVSESLPLSPPIREGFWPRLRRAVSLLFNRTTRRHYKRALELLSSPEIAEAD